MTVGHFQQPWTVGRRVFLFALLVIAIILGMAGQARGESLEPIRIASVFSATGPLSTQNVWSFSVVRLAAQKVNAQGGVQGRPIELVELDTQSTPLGARQAALEAVQAEVTAVIGPSFSSQAMAMGPVLQEAGIPMVGTNTTAPEVTRIGEYIFRICFTDEFKAKALARFAYDHLKARSVAVLHIVDDLYSEGLSSGFIEMFTALGGKSMVQLPYLLTDTDFSRQISIIKDFGPDLVLLDLNMPGMGGHKCLKALVRIDPEIQVIIASGYTANGHGRDALSSGARGFIGKPYQLKELAAIIRETLDTD